jgi:hypothetical protein
VNNDNQKASGSEELTGDGGGSLIGLAPVIVANANSRTATPEQRDFFMVFPLT